MSTFPDDDDDNDDEEERFLFRSTIIDELLATDLLQGTDA